MNLYIAALLLVWNVGASWANAQAAGRRWIWVRHATIGKRLPVWAAAAASAAGFTWVYVVLFCVAASQAGIIDGEVATRAAELGYVVTVLPILAFGAIQTASTSQEFRAAPSWRTYWRVNSQANILRYNWANLRHRWPQASVNLRGLMGSGRKDPRGTAAMIVAVIVTLGLLAGTITTIVLLRHEYGRQARQLVEHRKQTLPDDQIPGRTGRTWVAATMKPPE